MDTKLDFVPPPLINFISRQLIGSGFRLYQKTVASLSSFDQDYSKVLEDPMYDQMRRAFFPPPESNEEDVGGNSMNGNHTFLLKQDQHQSDARVEAEERATLVKQTNSGDVSNEKVDAIEVSSENGQMQERKAYGEIEEEDVAANGHSQQTIANGKDHVAEVFQNYLSPGEVNETSANLTKQKNNANYRRKIAIIRPEVKQALETLEKAITLVRCHGLKLDAVEVPSASNKEERNREVPAKAEVDAGVVGDGKLPERSSHESGRSSSSCDIRRAGSSLSTRETNHNKVAPASPDYTPVVLHLKTTSTTSNGARSERKEFHGLRKISFCCFATAPHE